MSNWINNWMMLTAGSQSEPCLALSEDFSSDEDGICGKEGQKGECKNRKGCNKCNEGNESNDAIIKMFLSPSSSSSSSSSVSVSSLQLSNNHSSSNLSIPLSWPRKYLLIPSYGVIFLAILPFIQGCMYSIGYRIGKRTLKLALKILKIE